MHRHQLAVALGLTLFTVSCADDSGSEQNRTTGENDVESDPDVAATTSSTNGDSSRDPDAQTEVDVTTTATSADRETSTSNELPPSKQTPSTSTSETPSAEPPAESTSTTDEPSDIETDTTGQTEDLADECESCPGTCAPGLGCVDCTEDNPDYCVGDTPVCDTSGNECVGCTEHSDCEVACNRLTGECMDDDPLYVEKSEKNCEVEADGTTDEPFCELSEALEHLDGDDGLIVVLDNDDYAGNLEIAEKDQVVFMVSLDKKRPGIDNNNGGNDHAIAVTNGATLVLDGFDIETEEAPGPIGPCGPRGPQLGDALVCLDDGHLQLADLIIGPIENHAIYADKCDIEGDDIFVEETNGDAIHLIDATLRLTNSEISSPTGLCISAEKSFLTIERSNLHDCEAGGIDLSEGSLDLSNSAIARNGTSSSSVGGLLLNEVELEQFTYNTVVGNNADADTYDPQGSSAVARGDAANDPDRGLRQNINCLEVEGTIRNSIISGSSAPTVQNDCLGDVVFLNNALDFDESESGWDSEWEDAGTDVGKLDEDWFEDYEDADFHLDDDGVDTLKGIAQASSDGPQKDYDGDQRSDDAPYVGLDEPKE